MDAIAVGPLLLALPQLYAFLAALALLLMSLTLLPLTAARRALWYNGLLLAWLLGARLGHVIHHADSYIAAPLDILKLWQGGYSVVWGTLAAAAWSAWCLRRRPTTLIAAETLLAASVTLWLGLMTWNPLGQEPGLRRLPDLALENLAGEPVELDGLRGKPLILNLWASWCAPCRREMPLLAEAAARPDVRVVLVNQGETLLVATRYLDALGHDFDRALLDPRQRLLTAAASPGLPTTLFFDARGELVARRVGELSRAQLDAWLKRHSVERDG